MVNEVSGYLGNTPAVARASYIDPRVITLYEQGIAIARAVSDLGEGREFGDVATRHAERAVLSMLTEHPSPALEAAAGVGRDGFSERECCVIVAAGCARGH